MDEDDWLDAPSRQLAERYEAMPANQRRRVALVDYHCRHRDHCLLLRVWQLKGHRYYYIPRYRLSPHVAESETDELARSKRTDDGLQRWRSRAGSLNDLIATWLPYAPTTSGLQVNCHHLRNVLLTTAELADDVSGAKVGAASHILLPR